MGDQRIERLADVLVRHSTRVKPGDLVALHGPCAAEPLLLALYREALRAGGHPVVVVTPEACAEVLYRHGSPAQLAFVNPLELQEVQTADVVVYVLAPQNTRALSQVDPARQALHGRGRRPLMEVFLQRSAERALRWVVTQLPCQAAAQDAGMSLGEYEDFVFGAGLLDRGDTVRAWEEQAARQQRLADFLAGARELRFVTPQGTDLRVGVAGRTWVNCAGRENFPDGEVFTGPLEDATEGTVCFDLPAVHGGREVRGVRLTFRVGRVADAAAAAGEEFLVSMLDQDAGARVLGEAALGCNYAVTRHTCNTLLDEKIGGTFHLALGASYPKSGGRNQSALHWDMVCDLRRGGRVEADGRPVSENGRFLQPDWPQPAGRG